MAALKADQRANRASNDTQSSGDMNDELTDGSNTDIIIGVENTDNTTVAAENVDNAATDAENTENDATNAENIDNAAINADNTSNTATDGKRLDDATMSDDNTDNATMSDNNTDDATTDDNNTENTTTGETSTVDVPSLLLYGRKTTDPSKVKTSKRRIPIMVKPSEPSIVDPPPNEIATAMASGHAFDPIDVHTYEFLIS